MFCVRQKVVPESCCARSLDSADKNTVKNATLCQQDAYRNHTGSEYFYSKVATLFQYVSLFHGHISQVYSPLHDIRLQSIDLGSQVTLRFEIKPSVKFYLAYLLDFFFSIFPAFFSRTVYSVVVLHWKMYFMLVVVNIVAWAEQFSCRNCVHNLKMSMRFQKSKIH